jgi:hypothetical protein
MAPIECPDGSCICAKHGGSDATSTLTAADGQLGCDRFTCRRAAARNDSAPARIRRDCQESDDQMRARLLGVLVYTNVTLSFDETPARDAIAALGDVIQIRIVGRYSDDRIGFGIDPTLPVSIKADNQEALSVLEEILEQCEVYEDCTWQLRKGFVEVSTKERLSVPAARELRTYNIRDFMIEPPQFASPHNSVAVPREHRYSCSVLGRPAPRTLEPDGSSSRRKAPEDLAMEIVEGIVGTIEPGRWDAGEEDDGNAERAQPIHRAPVNPGTSGQAARGHPPRSATGVAKWATVRLWRDELIIRAPDFIHRQINGYPRPIKPGPPAEEPAKPIAPTPVPKTSPGP